MCRIESSRSPIRIAIFAAMQRCYRICHRNEQSSPRRATRTRSPKEAEKWVIGANLAPSGWRAILSSDLPTDAAEYLRPSVIALDNIAASDLSSLQQQRLGQYVRDLGGGLVILGGDHAFAA